jgi:hypothetical protein
MKNYNIYCLSVCFSVCKSVHLSVRPSVCCLTLSVFCLSIWCLTLYLFDSIWMSVACIYVCQLLPVCLAFCQSSVCMSVSLCLFVYLSGILAIYASACTYIFCCLSYLNPSNPSSDPLTVRTGARAYAFAIRRFRSRTIT